MLCWLLGASALLLALSVLRRTIALITDSLGESQVSLGVQALAYQLRACMPLQECREMIGWALHHAIEESTPALWGLAVLAAAMVGWSVWSGMKAPRVPSLAGNARYARLSEIRRLTKRRAGAWLPLGYLPGSRLRRRLFRRPLSIWLQRLLTGPEVRLPAEDLPRHLLVVGLTGAHKTTAVTLPVLIAAAQEGISVVALDVKHGEADSLARAAPEWERWHRDVLVFAPLEATTLRWNPLDACRTIGDAQQLTAQLFDDPDPSNPDLVYWMGAERHVCAALCFALCMDGSPPTIGRLRTLCEAGPAAVHSYVHAHPRATLLTAKLGAYLAMLPKDQAGILQGIVSRLEAWGDESVCHATAVSSTRERIDLSRLRREPVLLLLGVPQAALGRLRWLCHLFLRDLAAHLLRPRRPEESVRVLLILEELPAWGALPWLADHLATYRSRQVTVLATLQSEAQGESIYGRDGWAAVAANLVTKMYFPSLADADAERLSEAMGTAAGEDIAWSRGWSARGSQRGEHRRSIPVPLQRPEDLRGLGAEPDEVVVRFARAAPARLWCPPYYQRPRYGARLDRLPRTEELVVYHHLWTLRNWQHDDDPRWSDRAPASVCAADPPPPVVHRPVRPQPERPRSTPTKEELDRQAATRVDAASPCATSPSPDDIAALHRVLEALLLHAERGHQGVIRGMRNGSRLTEVRVPAGEMAEICGSLDSMHEIGRRWSELRWTRRVRPTFVLGRRALGVLDSHLTERLHAVCAPAPPQPPR
jgi:type IV secretory pathway TraG/TraD family ATPase VirD4